MRRSILPGVLAAEPRRLDEVDLDRGKLPLASEYVARHEVRLGTVEGGLALDRLILDAVRIERRPQRIRRLLPLLVIRHVLSLAATQAELHVVAMELVRVEHLADQVQRPAELLFDLVGRTEDVAVVLRQAAHACEPRKLARLFVAVERRELGEAQWKLTV